MGALRDTLANVARTQDVTEFTSRFLLSEWTYVVDAWQIDSADAYAAVLATRELLPQP